MMDQNCGICMKLEKKLSKNTKRKSKEISKVINKKQVINWHLRKLQQKQNNSNTDPGAFCKLLSGKNLHLTL